MDVEVRHREVEVVTDVEDTTVVVTLPLLEVATVEATEVDPEAMRHTEVILSDLSRYLRSNRMGTVVKSKV